MNRKIFKQYTGDFFNDFQIISSPALSKPYIIKGQKILVGSSMNESMILKLIQDLLRQTGKTCNDLIKHMDVLVLSDRRKLQGSYPRKFLINTANSCAIDSIIFILFFTQRSFFMNKIYQSTNSETDKGKRFKANVLPLLDNLYTNFSKWSGKATMIQKAITPFITAAGCDDIKSGTEIWSMFSNAFTKLQFLYQSERDRKIGNKPSLRTYLDIANDDDPILVHDQEFLIYADDKRPIKQNLQPIHDLQVGDYELSAVLFFNSGHYTSAVKVNDKWVYYDDLLDTVRLLKNPEKFIFNETINHKLQMLFYIKN